jgi:hypothetical protein
MQPTVKAARTAGAIYLLEVLSGPFSLIYVPSALIVSGNAAATAANILAHETMFSPTCSAAWSVSSSCLPCTAC